MPTSYARKDPVSLVRRAVRGVTPYHLDRHDVAVKLDQNENCLGVPEVLREDLVAALRKAPLHRYPTPGHPEILEGLSSANRWPAAGILVGNGSDELLHNLAQCFLEPGRKALVPAPSFFVYGYTAKLMGAEALEVPLTAEMQYDVDAILKAMEEHVPEVVYLCSPNNPTGSYLEPEDLETLVARAPGIVALDEAYWEFASWNARSLLDSHENLVLFRTFSKAMAMAGLRLGYAMTSPELAREIRKTQQPYPLNLLSLEAAGAALAHAELLRARAGEIVEERDRLHARMKGTAGVEVFPSKGNFLMFRTSLGAKRTFEALLSEGVLVRNVSGNPRLPEMLRVGVGTAEENETFFHALQQALEKNP